MTVDSHPTSKIDDGDASPWAGEPHFAETVTLLRSVRDHDFDTLAALCDDDFGIVDLDQAGQNVMVRTRDDWEEWFRRLSADIPDALTP